MPSTPIVHSALKMSERGLKVAEWRICRVGSGIAPFSAAVISFANQLAVVLWYPLRSIDGNWPRLLLLHEPVRRPRPLEPLSGAG